MNLRRQVIGLAAVALVTGAVVATTPPALSAPARTAPTPAGATHTVTLVTGDQVTMSSDGTKVSALPGPGRKGVTFDVTTDGGRVRVVPSDAGPLLASGRLDARLFDVTGLVEAGYDRTAELPLIVTGGTARARIAGLQWTHDLPAVNGTAVRQSRAGAADSWQALRAQRAGGKVWLDGMRQPALDVSVPKVGAPTAWAAGYTGEGTTVAVLDSGVDDTHPDLAGQVTARQNFTEDNEPDADLEGHGTHVAATVAGTGAGRYKGVAPGAKLLDGKVCIQVGCAESWILAGMTWAAAEQHADVVNLSLGGPDDPGVVDPIEEAVGTLSEQYGTLFVIAAGNTDGGVVEGVISSPGTADAALTVGAMDDNDAVANFSRRGPTGDGRLKPEISAPGVDITAAGSKDAFGDTRYVTMSGTSMATPHVAGAAAILAQRHPDWTGQQIKASLVGSAQPNPADRVRDQGSGRLDVAGALGQVVTTSPASVSFTRQQWPHHDDEVQSREVTYRNDGTAAVSLDLAIESAPAGFGVSADSVEVPAGGTATVTVTVDTRVAGPDGYLAGRLVATGTDQVVRTPVGVDKEVESYDVTLNHLDRNGAVPEYFSSRLVHRDSTAAPIGWTGPDPGGSVTLRVPAGHYTLTSAIFGELSTSEPGSTLLAQPDLHVDRPLTIDLDARAGRPVSVTVPRSSATQVFAELAAYSRGGTAPAGHIVFGGSFANMYSARLGQDAVDDKFFSVVAGQWAQANGEDSPYLYTLFFPVRDRMVHGYERAVVDRELAKVRVDVAQAQPGTRGTKRISGGSRELGVGFFGAFLSFPLPFSRTEYYNDDIESVSQFTESSEDGGTIGGVDSPEYVGYEAGRSYRERWNAAVFTPSLPDTASSLDFWRGVTRDGDRLWVDVPMFGDGAGHDGHSVTTAAGATLFRGGTKIGETDGSRWSGIDVPADEADYRLEVRAERGTPFALSTRTDVVWTFRSGNTDGPVQLPLWTVRFGPNVDQYNALPSGGVHAVPVRAIPQSGSAPGTLGNLTVDASFDDGVTWRKVPVVGGVAKIPHPQGNGFVSLRARAVDSDGNTVTQTVVRAYRYGRP